MTRRAAPRRPARLVVVASTPRTGSNLLCAALGASGLAPDGGYRWEVLMPWLVFHRHLRKPWPLRIRLHTGRLWRWWSADEPWKRRMRTTRGARRAYLDFVADARTTADGVLALKVMWRQYEQALLLDGLDINPWGVPVTWVHTWRRDEVRQAVSFARSTQTGKWVKGMRVPRNVAGSESYDAALIAQCIATVRESNSAWRAYFDSIGVTPIEVVYEDLDADYEGTMRRVLDELGCSDRPVAPRQIERQSDALSDEWVERFRAEQGVHA